MPLAKKSRLWGAISPKRGESKIIPPAKSVELKRLKELIYRSPDIREDMVADLRTRVLGGAYKIGSDQVAEKLIQHGAYILDMLRGHQIQSTKIEHPRKSETILSSPQGNFYNSPIFPLY